MKGSWIPFGDNTPGSKGLIGRNVIRWMEIYFSKQCDIMPTTGRIHLSYNFSHRVVYQAYKDDMLKGYCTYIIDMLIDYGDRYNLTVWLSPARFAWMFAQYVEV